MTAEVAAFITTMGFFASVATGATAKTERQAEAGENVHLVLDRSSCARRLLTIAGGAGSCRP